MHSYQYDKDNRLWTAKGTSPNSSLSYDQYMSYSPAGAIYKKDIQMSSIKNGAAQSYTYFGRYKYTSQSNPYAAQYIYDENNNYTLDETLCWDRAGNLSLSASNATGIKEAMYWTEDNRMQLYIRMGGDNSVAYYRYDHTGEREMKLRGRLMDVYNMGNQHNFINFDEVVLYAGDLATFDRQGFKKHYFVEGRRFLTNVGSVGMPIMDEEHLQELAHSEDIERSSMMFEENLIDYLTTRRNACSYVAASIDIGWLEWMSEWCLEILTNERKNLPYYLHTDRLGSGTVVTNEKGDAVHILTYMPHGETLLDLSRGFETPYQFTGYEKDHESGLYYAGARYYNPKMRSFNSTDPLWWKSPDKTSYHYCSNNPVNRVDPNGMADDWYEAENGTVTWTDYTSQQELDDNGIKGSYLGNVVVDINGSLDEKLGKNDNLFGEGAVLATATVYGANGKDDIQSYDAFTMTSDYSLFGAIADGEYQVNYRNPGKGGALKSNWAVNNTYPVDCIDGKNPSPIHPYSKTQKDGIYIHSSNKNGFAGKYYHKDGVNKGQLKGAISTGCILIVPSRYDNKGNPLNNGWNQFNKQLQGVTSFKLRLNRK